MNIHRAPRTHKAQAHALPLGADVPAKHCRASGPPQPCEGWNPVVMVARVGAIIRVARFQGKRPS